MNFSDIEPLTEEELCMVITLSVREEIPREDALTWLESTGWDYQACVELINEEIEDQENFWGR